MNTEQTATRWWKNYTAVGDDRGQEAAEGWRVKLTGFWSTQRLCALDVYGALAYSGRILPTEGVPNHPVRLP